MRMSSWEHSLEQELIHSLAKKNTHHKPTSKIANSIVFFVQANVVEENFTQFLVEFL